eukprot:4753856-Prymnesium_polylepis.1
MAVDAAACDHCIKEVAHLRLLPEGIARHGKVGEEHAVAGERREARLEAGRCHVFCQPRVEGLDGLAVSLAGLQAKG